MVVPGNFHNLQERKAWIREGGGGGGGGQVACNLHGITG